MEINYTLTHAQYINGLLKSFAHYFFETEKECTKKCWSFKLMNGHNYKDGTSDGIRHRIIGKKDIIDYVYIAPIYYSIVPENTWYEQETFITNKLNDNI